MVSIKEQRLRISDAHRVHEVHQVYLLAQSTIFKFAFAIVHPSMANYARYTVAFIIIVGVVCGQACSMLEDAEKSVLGLNLPYGRGLDSELQLAKLLMVAPRFCHPKRNSELINSLLGLPQNMHNAGK